MSSIGFLITPGRLSRRFVNHGRLIHHGIWGQDAMCEQISLLFWGFASHVFSSSCFNLTMFFQFATKYAKPDSSIINTTKNTLKNIGNIKHTTFHHIICKTKSKATVCIHKRHQLLFRGRRIWADHRQMKWVHFSRRRRNCTRRLENNREDMRRYEILFEMKNTGNTVYTCTLLHAVDIQ